MAKIAGRKNDGAWYRFNKWILKQESVTQQQFSQLLAQSDEILSAYDAVQKYIVRTGASVQTFPSSPQAWAHELSIGVPRQIWDGVTTYDAYVKAPVGQGFQYQKLMQHAIFEFSKVVRKCAKIVRFGTSEIKHLAGLTHPTPHAASQKQEGESAAQYRARRLAELIAFDAAHPAAKLEKNELTPSADESISTALDGGTSTPKVGRSARRA